VKTLKKVKHTTSRLGLFKLLFCCFPVFSSVLSIITNDYSRTYKTMMLVTLMMMMTRGATFIVIIIISTTVIMIMVMMTTKTNDKIISERWSKRATRRDVFQNIFCRLVEN